MDMSNASEAYTVPMLKLVGVYTACLIVVLILYGVISYFFSYDGSGLTLIGFFVSGMTMADYWVKREKAAPPNGRAWLVSGICAMVTMAIMVSIATLAVLLNDSLLDEVMAEGEAGLALVVILSIAMVLLIALLGVLIIRLGAMDRQVAGRVLSRMRHPDVPGLFHAVGDTALGEVVGGHFDLYLVASQDADVILAHATGNMGNDFVAVFQFDPEHGVGQGLSDRAFKFDGIVFRHANPWCVARCGQGDKVRDCTLPGRQAQKSDGVCPLRCGGQ
ncbi:hypothetical protein FQR65_LT20328 [Abscondita terminalis]|nr:hypothetical protein FQR65_LT20328 [Abscondita terminalis]